MCPGWSDKKSKQIVLITCLFIYSFFLSNIVFAEPVPSHIGPIYYKIGGGRVAGSPLAGFRTIRINASFSAGFGYSCGEFDPHESVSRMVNQIRDQVRELPAQLEAAFTAAMVSIPGYLFKRSYPGLYGVITKTLDDSFNLFQLSMKSCKQIEREMAKMGDDYNPYQNLLRASVAERWEFEVGVDDGRSIDQIEKEIDEQVGRQGIRWLDGVNYAGLDQDPIRFNRDLVIAGYNTLIGRSPDMSSAETSAPEAPFDDHYIVEVWPNPVAAADFLIDIVGEKEIMTDGSEPTTRPGMGLRPFVDTMTLMITEALTAAVNENLWGGIRELDSMGVATPVVEAIRKEEEYVRSMMISKVAGEMAVAETQERIQLIKQLLTAGLKDADITASKAASTAATFVRNETMPELDDQIKDIIEAYAFRTQFLHKTSLTILKHDASQDLKSIGKEAPKLINPNTIRNTGVPQ